MANGAKRLRRPVKILKYSERMVIKIRMNNLAPGNYAAAVEERLKLYLPENKLIQSGLFDSMRYSLLAGGKRIRPILLLEFCRLCGGNPETALPFACAAEMIHTYSLIHDDLPCMDNDDMRRGRPSNHTVFGEAEALLAGDALLTLAFETMLSPENIRAAGAERAAEAAGVLARASGAYGMAGGQEVDLKSAGKHLTEKILRQMDQLKTGALIQASAEAGCVLAGADEEKRKAANLYSSSIGLAFQIVDDILDETESSESLGKPAGSDRDKKKSTYVFLMGIDRAGEEVVRLTDTAVSALKCFGPEGSYLAGFAEKLALRRN